MYVQRVALFIDVHRQRARGERHQVAEQHRLRGSQIPNVEADEAGPEWRNRAKNVAREVNVGHHQLPNELHS